MKYCNKCDTLSVYLGLEHPSTLCGVCKVDWGKDPTTIHKENGLTNELFMIARSLMAGAVLLHELSATSDQDATDLFEFAEDCIDKLNVEYGLCDPELDQIGLPEIKQLLVLRKLSIVTLRHMNGLIIKAGVEPRLFDYHYPKGLELE